MTDDAPLHHDPHDAAQDRRLMKDLLRALLDTAMAERDRARDAMTPVQFSMRRRGGAR